MDRALQPHPAPQAVLAGPQQQLEVVVDEEEPQVQFFTPMPAPFHKLGPKSGPEAVRAFIRSAWHGDLEADREGKLMTLIPMLLDPRQARADIPSPDFGKVDFGYAYEPAPFALWHLLRASSATPRQANGHPGGNMLDLAAGNGNYGLPIAVGGNLKVIALELPVAVPLLKMQARARLAQIDASDAPWATCKGDVLKGLSIHPDASYAVINCQKLFHFLSGAEARRVVQTMHRLTKPGGVLVFSALTDGDDVLGEFVRAQKAKDVPFPGHLVYQNIVAVDGSSCVRCKPREATEELPSGWQSLPKMVGPSKAAYEKKMHYWDLDTLTHLFDGRFKIFDHYVDRDSGGEHDWHINVVAVKI